MITRTVSSARRKLAAGIVAFAVIAGSSLVATPAFAVTGETTPKLPGGSVHPVDVTFLSNSRAYVVDQNGFVNVVAAGSDTVIKQIDVTGAPPQPNCFLTGGGLSGDGLSLYVAGDSSCTFGPRLLKFSTQTNTLTTSEIKLPDGTNRTGAVAVTPDGALALVWGVDSTGAVLFKVPLGGGGSISTVPLGVAGIQREPSAVLITEDGTTAYTTTRAGTIAKINIAAGTVSSTILVASSPGVDAARGLAMSSDESTLYASTTEGKVYSIPTSTGVASIISTITSFSLTAIDVTADGSTLVVAGATSGGGADAAYVIPTTGGSPTRTFSVGNGPSAVAISPSGQKAYVTSDAGGTTSILQLVDVAPTFTADTAPTTGKVGVSYTTQFKASGSPAATFSVASGALPAGLTMYSSGKISGKPTKTGTSTFTVKAMNSEGNATSAPHTIKVSNGTIVAKTPTVSGTKEKGKTLTAKAGTWTPSPVTLKYQWQRYSKSKWVTISGATKTTYKVASADKGLKVRVKVTGTKGYYTTVIKYSASATIKK